MPSEALSNFQERLQEVEQLIDAHTALVRYKKAEAVVTTGTLADVSKVIDALVSKPGVGRPGQVQALNSAGIALLSAHLQGFMVELFEEAAGALLQGRITDLDALKDVAPTRGNPNVQNINRLFAAIGFRDILEGLSWQGMSNKTLKAKLRTFNELRNRIAHGKAEVVRKNQLVNYKKVWESLAKKLDKKIAAKIKRVTGQDPW